SFHDTSWGTLTSRKAPHPIPLPAKPGRGDKNAINPRTETPTNSTSRGRRRAGRAALQSRGSAKLHRDRARGRRAGDRTRELEPQGTDRPRISNGSQTDRPCAGRTNG